jgi:ABC-2 type transport system ATP-binding protein
VADECIIETSGLRKRYDGIDALAGLDLRVPRGSIYGFLGRNGAGKTTTVKVLMGMARPTAGTARVFGLACDVDSASVDIRRRVGFVNDEKDLYDAMTVDGMIRFTARFYPRWRRDLEAQYLRRFDLPSGREVKALSRGMRTKLALLLSLCRGAELLILDEPTSGLDPAITEEVLQAIVRHVAGEEMTVFFSSHQIAEVEQIADHVAIIDRGRGVLAGALDDLRHDFRRVEFVFENDAPMPAFSTPGVERVRRSGRVLSVLSSAGTDRLIEEGRTLRPLSVDTAPVSLKEIFLESVGMED